MAIIIGIDPGSIHTGWGVIQYSHDEMRALDFGVIHAAEHEALPLRLARIYNDLREVLARFQPQAIAIEKVFFGKNAASAFTLGQARGVVMCLAGQFQLETSEYATRHVKKMVTGTGAASKEQVQLMIEQMLQIRARELDASDALALAVCHARSLEVAQMLKRQHEAGI